MRLRRMFDVALAAIAVLALAGCGSLCQQFCPAPGSTTLTPTMEGSAQGEFAYLWLAADKDAWVGCTSPGCTDGDLNHGTLFSLDVGQPIPPGDKRIYVEFYMPELPPGARIVEAYINLYEDSRQVPDTFPRPVIAVNDEWDPRLINRSNEPMPLGALSQDAQLGSFRDVNQWRGTLPVSDIGRIAREHLAYPSRNHGFLINNPANVTFLRSFTSDNAPSRTATDMDHSPRLLLKVQLPGGPEGYLDASNVGLPPLPADTDLDEFLTGPGVLMVRLAGGANWPPSWDVATN